jgi:hypothetical protein
MVKASCRVVVFCVSTFYRPHCAQSHLVQEQLDEMLDTLVGLQTAADLRVGETLITGDVPTATAFYRRLFEVRARD